MAKMTNMGEGVSDDVICERSIATKANHNEHVKLAAGSTHQAVHTTHITLSPRGRFGMITLM